MSLKIRDSFCFRQSQKKTDKAYRGKKVILPLPCYLFPFFSLPPAW